MFPSSQLGLKHCNGCGLCCRKSTCHLVPSDVDKIREQTELEVDIYGLPDGTFRVKTKMGPNGCVYLTEDNQCGINSVKPKGGADYECWTPSTWLLQYEWDFKDVKRYFKGVTKPKD